MSDAVQIALIASVGPAIIGILGAYFNFKNGQKIEVVKKATDGNLSEQLRIAAVAAKTLATVDNKPENVILAQTAQEKYEAHEKANT